MASKEPGIRAREDGFYEVSGLGGYHHKAEAVRIARQLGVALETAAKTGRPYREANPGEEFDDGQTADEVEAELLADMESGGASKRAATKKAAAKEE